MIVKNLQDIETFLYAQIPQEKAKFPGKFGLMRIKEFLITLGNPQNKLKIIHIAGTSGKGSTAYLASLLLKSQGFKVGLKLSPHIIDFRERFQINNQILKEDVVVGYFNELLPLIKKFNQNNPKPLTYFEILVSLGFFIFCKEKVDYAVVETGLGGLYDGTNCIDGEKLVILTKIGLDHVEILGDTIEKIAYQKAGIITAESSVISIEQEPSAIEVIKKAAQKKLAPLKLIDQKNYNFKKGSENLLFFDFQSDDFELKNVALNTSALYQIENCSLALAALNELSKRDNFILQHDAIFNFLKEAHFAGRMDVIKYRNRILILDGAHNPQKMAALMKSVVFAYPQQKLNFIVSFKRDKDYEKMLEHIISAAGKIYLTNFSEHQDSHIMATNPSAIAEFFKKKGFSDFEIIHNPAEALDGALQSSSDDPIVITGSFYLLSKMYALIRK